MANPLVSVIVPTKNSAASLEECLNSVVGQTYENIELIVVDNYSTDATQDIARLFTPNVYSIGPERSTQRNFGALKARGDFLAMIDSDMELTPNVIGNCINNFRGNYSQAIIVPEESFGIGYWAKCKALERSFYIGDDSIEAARVFARHTFTDVGGYDESLISGEDWDLSSRLRKVTKISRIEQLIMHNEGRLLLMASLRKKYFYAKKARAYLALHPEVSVLGSGSGPLHRFVKFFSHPKRLVEHPLLAPGMLFMKACEYGAGAIGLLITHIPWRVARRPAR